MIFVCLLDFFHPLEKFRDGIHPLHGIAKPQIIRILHNLNHDSSALDSVVQAAGHPRELASLLSQFQ